MSGIDLAPRPTTKNLVIPSQPTSPQSR